MSASEHDAESLSLAETLRIMDVASELRSQRETAQRELEMDELKTRLEHKLLETARLTGEELEPADVRSAVDWYYNNLHAFREPPWSFSTLLAHMYIRRGRLMLAALGFVAFAAVAWWFLGGGSG